MHTTSTYERAALPTLRHTDRTTLDTFVADI